MKNQSALSVALVAAELTNDQNTKSLAEAVNKANNKVMLPLADSDVLQKKQPVATAGSVTREIKQHVVLAGETLTELANRYNVTTDTIRWANNLGQNALLDEGWSLTILPTSGVLYKVQDGDTLAGIADKYKASSEMILNYNLIKENEIKQDVELIIPDGVIEEPKPVTTVATTQTTTTQNNVSNTPTTTARPGNVGYNNYAYGYCTWYVANRRGDLPPSMGDARNWYYAAQSYGYAVGSVPAVGAVAWTPNGYYGHVAYVEAVNGDQVFISEMNYNGGWGVTSTRWASASSFSYIY